MSTNRLHFIDEAIVRRASVILEFERPKETERKDLFEKSLVGINFSKEELQNLADLTSPEQNDGLGHSFSDIRLKVIPEAIAMSFPDNPLTFEILCVTIKNIKPSPKVI